MKPTFFISSTIFDFSDLRAAIKWLLEEKGYVVNASEYNDFQKPIDINSYDACLKAIDNCQYFILLIGDRIGGTYNEEITITNMEYRYAYQRAIKGELKIINFIRKETWTIYSEDKRNLKDILKTTSYKDIEESVLTFEKKFRYRFIDEVRRLADMKNGVKPVSNWLHNFDTFSEIVGVLETELKDKSGLIYKQNRFIINEEIRSNLLKVYTKEETHTGLKGWLIESLFKDLRFDFDKPFITLNDKQIVNYAMFFIQYMSVKEWKYDYIGAYYRQGFFLEYDTCLNDYVQGDLQKLAGNLISSYIRLNSLHKTVFEKTTEKMVALSKKPDQSHKNVKPLDLFMALEFSDELFNCLQISKELYKALLKLPYKIPQIIASNRLPEEMKPKSERHLTHSELDILLKG